MTPMAPGARPDATSRRTCASTTWPQLCRCNCGAIVVQKWCKCGAIVVHLWCQLQARRDQPPHHLAPRAHGSSCVRQVQSCRCHCGAIAMQLWCQRQHHLAARAWGPRHTDAGVYDACSHGATGVQLLCQLLPPASSNSSTTRPRRNGERGAWFRVQGVGFWGLALTWPRGDRGARTQLCKCGCGVVRQLQCGSCSADRGVDAARRTFPRGCRVKTLRHRRAPYMCNAAHTHTDSPCPPWPRTVITMQQNSLSNASG